MATKLNGKVEREVEVPGIGRPLIVALDAEAKCLWLREKGCHKSYRLPLYTAFLLAIRSDSTEKNGKEK
jgi:hypothetical protein